VELNPKAEIGPATLCEIVLARGAGTVFCKKWQRIMISEEGHA
jgi:hypothetical protein